MLCAPAPAAVLVGGAREQAIKRAFAATGGRDRLIVSVRRSTVDPSWSVVRWVAIGSDGVADLTLHSSYLHQLGAAEQPGGPPAPVAADLRRRFTVAVVYSGTGSESISYRQRSSSECSGQGGTVDQQTVTITPIAWSVRYLIDLDDVLAASGPPGAGFVPRIVFDSDTSRVEALESATQTTQDLGCNRGALTFSCTTTFGLGGPDPDGSLSLDAGSGLQIGLPLVTRSSGACNPAEYTLGPSQWDGGGAAVLVSRLALAGGQLPDDPYAPIRVRASDEQVATSPCQGEPGLCADTFDFSGVVELRPA